MGKRAREERAKEEARQVEELVNAITEAIESRALKNPEKLLAAIAAAPYVLPYLRDRAEALRGFRNDMRVNARLMPAANARP